MNRDLRSIYLNDHLAGATVGRELARRAAGSNRSGEYGPFLEGLATEIDEDREALLEIMRAMGVGTDPIKVLAGWTAEKAGRLKPNGRLRGYSPLSRVVELEALLLGVRGKLALWLTLQLLESSEPQLGTLDLGRLVERARRQLDQIEEHRLRAARQAMVSEPPSRPRAGPAPA
jgi:hypothetical protein